MTDAAVHLKALAEAEPYPYWFDDRDEPVACAALIGTVKADLCVVGGGYTGLWTAIGAKRRNPSLDVVLLEGDTVGWGGSGRNGGFMESSLTHGLANGQQRFPKELPRLEELGLANLDAIEATIRAEEIDCDFERNGVIDVATSPHLVAALQEDYEQLVALGHDVALFDREAMRAEIDSPTYHGGLWRKGRAALVDPARLAWGLKRVALDLGVRIHEHTKVDGLERDGKGMKVTAPFGRVLAGKVALGTNAFPPLVRAIRRYIVPVYDYVLVTEPLSSAQMASIGWRGRQGLSDNTNQFHYYRVTADNRILWGGYDAVYYFGGKVSPTLEQRPETFVTLSAHFFTTFPQLEGIRFTHAWGGAIDTCTRFCQFWGSAYDSRVAYVVGYTGLGVAATRFGAEVMLDKLEGRKTERTELEFVRRKPIPFPPEPLRFVGIQLTRWSLQRADADRGRRNAWLRMLDRLGLGFDS